MKTNYLSRIFLGLTIIISKIYCEKEKDLYKVLGVSRSATANEIKRKYRELSRTYHPDKNKSKDASAKFSEVNEANEVLSDPKKRRLYDRGGMDAVNSAQQQGGEGFDPFDIFGNFFGGGRRGGEQRDQDLRVKIRVSLNDLYLGKEHEFTYTRNTVCPNCRGSGADSHDDVSTCDKCNGQGIVLERQQIAPGFVQQFQTTCPKCKGKGKMIKKVCHVCQGKKIVKGLEELTLYIEKGMQHGQEIKFEEFGEERADVAPGNLVFIVNELPHSVFRREKNDLHVILKISLREALLGFNREIEHLDKHMVQVQRDSISQPGDVIKIRGEGMPVHQSGDRGDLFVKIEIVLPSALTEKQKELCKLLFDKRSYW